MARSHSELSIKPSEILLFLAGIFLFASLPFLSSGRTDLWYIARALYGVGILLYILDK